MSDRKKLCGEASEELDDLEFVGFSGLQVGDIIEFGRYLQSAEKNAEAEPIEWIVLDIKDGRALLISKYALCCQPYHKKKKNVTWESCTLRMWLNNGFLREAFFREERAYIPAAAVSAADNPMYPKEKPESNTLDTVFLLSISEAERYFKEPEERACVPTEYAKAQGAQAIYGSPRGCNWWLRTSGIFQYYAAEVNYDGNLLCGGCCVNENNAVRPAMWINFEHQTFIS